MVIIQFFVSLLDLIGVLLLGVVMALTSIAATGTELPANGLGSILNSFPTDITFVIGLAMLAGFSLIAKSLLGLLLTRQTFKFLAKRQALVAGNIAEKLLSSPLLQVQSRSSQETALALTQGVSALTIGTLGPAIVIAAELSLILVLGIGLLFVDPLVALFSIGFFGLLLACLHYLLGSWASRLGRHEMSASIGSFATLQHVIRAYRDVSVSGRRGLFIKRFQAWQQEAAKVLADQYILSQIGKYIFEIGLVVGAALLILFVSYTTDVSAAVGIITIFLAASARLFPSLLRMQAALGGIRSASGVGAITLVLLDELDRTDRMQSQTVTANSHGANLYSSIRSGYLHFNPSVSLSSISLSFPGASKLALDCVSLDIAPNEAFAIVGATGAGKSTLVDVILGVLLPDSGNVSISGITPHDCVEQWPGAMAYVPQDVAVLTGTVRENVALGIPAEFIDDSLVWEALERAELSSFLHESRDGIETIVGENGVQLSGGQRQRLGIARALYSRPKLLVLDEATSALDAETERIITQTLASLAGDVTLIVIAHRLATVRHCDQVVHLSEGRITGRGTFSEVRAQVPEFARQADLLGL